jgi:hypothetical protein
MPGGLLQLVSIGKQDSILIENPQISYFKTVYKKPTLFAIESFSKPVEITAFNDIKQFTVPNYGDLLKNLNFKLDLPTVQFDYEVPIDKLISNILQSDLYDGQISTIYFNINKLKTIELILFNNIKNLCRQFNRREINSLKQVNDSLIYLKDNSIDLLFDEITLQDVLQYPSYEYNGNVITEKSKGVTAKNINANTANDIFTNMLYRKNADKLLSNEEDARFGSILDNLSAIKNYTGNNVQNYDTKLITNIKLELSNIIQQNFDLYLYYINVSKYLEGILTGLANENISFDHQINMFDGIMNKLVTNLQYAVIQLDELFSYHQIITSPSSDIKSLEFTTNNMYYLTVPTMIYNFNMIIIVANDGNSTYQTINIRRILYLVRITSGNTDVTINEGTMIIQAADIFDNYNLAELSNNQFITCSDNTDDLLTFSNYIPVHNITPTEDIKLERVFSAGYIFEVIGNYTKKFTTNKLAFIFSNNLSSSPYDYFYNKLESGQYYYPLAVYVISSSTYDIGTNKTSIVVNRMNFTDAVAEDDKVYVKDNFLMEISNMTVAALNTDVVNNYNGYLQSGLTNGMSDTEIHTNLQSLLLNCIKYNSKYLMNMYQKIFDSSLFLYDMLEIFVSPADGSFLRPTTETKNTKIENVAAFIKFAITDVYTTRDTNDTGYNFYDEHIKNTITNLFTSYQQLTLNYHTAFYKLGNVNINDILKLISVLTTAFDINGTNSVSNIKLNETGYTQEYMLVYSTTDLIPSTTYNYNIAVNKYSMMKYINDKTNNIIKYNRLNTITDKQEFVNPTCIATKNGIYYVVDDNKQIYKFGNLTVEKLLHDSNKYNELAVKEDIMPWSSAIRLAETNFEVIQTILINADAKYIIERDIGFSNYLIYYISKTNEVVSIKTYLNDELPFRVTSLFNLGKLYFVNAMYYYIGHDGTTYRDRLITNIDTVNQLQTKNISKIVRNIDHNTIDNYFHYQYYNDAEPSDTHPYIYTFMADLQNKLLYVMRNKASETGPEVLTNVIHLINYVYVYAAGSFRSDINEDFSILTFQMKQDPADPHIFYMMMYIRDNTTNNYYFDEYTLTMLYNDVYYKLTFDRRITVLGDTGDLPINVYKFASFYYELYKQKIIKSQPNVDNVLSVIVEQRSLVSPIIKVSYNNTYIALYFQALQKIEISLITDVTNSTANKLVLPYTSSNVRNMSIDNIDAIMNTINNITYNINDKAAYLYVIDENNTVVLKIISLRSGNVGIDDNITLKFNQSTYGKLYSTYRPFLMPTLDTHLHMIAETGVLKYDIRKKTITTYKTDNSFTYLFDDEESTISDYLNKLIIHDTSNLRIITCAYTLDKNNNLSINDIQSFNYIPDDMLMIANPLRVIVNPITADNYASNTTQHILFVDDSYVSLFKLNGTVYNYIGSRHIAQLLNILALTYNDKGQFIFITYSGSDIYVNSTSASLDELLDANLTITSQIINGITDSANTKYKLYSSGTDIYLSVTDTDIDSFNTSLYQLNSTAFDTYDYVLLIDKDVSTQYPNTTPYITNNISLENISDIKLLTNNDCLILNDKYIYYTFGKFIYQMSYSNVNAIDAFAEYIYIHRSSSALPSDNTFIIYNTKMNTTVTYDVNESIFPIAKFYSLRSVGIDNYVVLSDANNIYIYELTDTTMTQKHSRTTSYNIKSLSFTIYEYISDTPVITMMVLGDDYKIYSFKIDIDNATFGNRTSPIITYAKPYFITKVPVSAASQYTQMPEVNYPILQHIEYKDGIYFEHIFGQENSKIEFTLYDSDSDDFPITLTSGKIYKIVYKLVKEEDVDVPYPKDVRKAINDNSKLINSENSAETLTIMHQYTNNTGTSPPAEQNITTNNSYTSSDFKINQSNFNVYNVSSRAYTDKRIKNYFTLNMNEIDDIYISIADCSVNTTINIITIVYDITLNQFNTYLTSKYNTTIYNMKGDEYIELTDATATNATNYKTTQQFPIYDGSALITAHTSKGYYPIKSLVYQNNAINTMITNSLLTVTYKIDNISVFGVSDYIFIEKDNTYSLAKIVNLDSTTDYLYIYYKLLDKVSPYYNTNSFKTSMYVEVNNNTLTVYNNLISTMPDIDYATDVNYYNANVILLDYINYLAISINEFNTRLDDDEDNELVNNDVNTLLNNEFIRQVTLVQNDDQTIINSNSTHNIYDIGFDTGFTNPKPLYIKLSHNYNNMTGYRAINNYLTNNTIRLYLRSYVNNINELYANSKDYILSQLKIITVNYGDSSLIAWDIVSEKNPQDAIIYIYKYIRELIKLADKVNDFGNFVAMTVANSSYFLVDNINAFKEMYDSIIDKYELADWLLIKNTIHSLHEGMIKIDKILHGRFINDNGTEVYLLNRYFVQPIDTFNNITYYLDELDDNLILNYLSALIEKLYINYKYNTILGVQQSIIDLYFTSLNNLFDGTLIGTTTYKNINKVLINYDVNMANIYASRDLIPEHGQDPFIQASSYGLLRLPDIVTYLTGKSNDNSDKITYYRNNNAILNIAKLDRNDLFERYRNFIATRPISTITAAAANTITISPMYDVNVGGQIGFYFDSTYNIYTITDINYATNTVTLDTTLNLSTIPVKSPVLIGMEALKLQNLTFEAKIISNTTNSITVDNLKYVEKNQYVSFLVKQNTDLANTLQQFRITDIDFENKTLTIDLSNLYNMNYPDEAALVVNASINQTVIIGTTFDPSKLYVPSVFSSPAFAEMICTVIFNSFEGINNVAYNAITYWNYIESDSYKYFRKYGTIDADEYERTIKNKLIPTYKIDDLKILSYAFEHTFTKANRNHTIDRLLSTFTNIINLDKIGGNTYYKVLYMSYMLNNNLKATEGLFEQFVNEINIENAFDIVEANTDESKFAILKLANQCATREEFIYDNFKIDYMPIYELKTSIDHIQYDLLLKNTTTNDHLYPYVNTAIYKKENLLFGSARILQNKNCTLFIKIKDVLSQLENSKTYYGIGTDELKQHFIDAYLHDETTKAFAKNFIFDKMLLSDHTRFDIYNSRDYHLEYFHELQSYHYPSDIVNITENTVLFRRDVIIDRFERAGYMRLVFQQLLMWSLLKTIIPNIRYSNLYYRTLPNNIVYNNSEDNMDVLTDIQQQNIEYHIDLFVNYFSKITTTGTDIETDINMLLNMVDIIDNDTFEKWDTFIDTFNDVNLTFDYCSKLVLPCHLCYIAYELNKLFSKPIYNTTQYVYSNEKYKKDLRSYIVKGYTQEQIAFLIEQKNKDNFSIQDWMGEIDGVAKVYLCNRYDMYNEMETFKPYDNNIVTFSNLYMLIQLKSAINGPDDNLTLLNYLLMTTLNENMNYVEAKLRYNENDLIDKYPTLYLINGKLIRVTNLPNELYYIFTDISTAINPISAFKIGKCKLNKENNSSTILTYNIFQKTINNVQTRLKTELFTYYTDNNIITDDILTRSINVTNNYAFIRYNFTITDITSNIITIDCIYSNDADKIDTNSYFYIEKSGNYYYYFIEAITYNDFNTSITIYEQFSDDINLIETNDTIYGGIYNILNKIYENNETRYILSSNIIDRYDDYIYLTEQLKRYVSEFYGYKFETDKQIGKSITETLYLESLMRDIINGQDRIGCRTANKNKYIDINKLYDIRVGSSDLIKVNIDIYNNVKAQIQKNTTMLSAIQTDKLSRINNLLSITAWPNNEFLPVEPKGNWINYLGHYIFDYLELYMGDQLIQRITDDYMHIYYQTNIPLRKRKQYLQYIGYTEQMLFPRNIITGQSIYVMVPWFFSNSGNNLPMIALINTAVTVKVKTKDIAKLMKVGYNVKITYMKNNAPNIKSDMRLDYIFLEEQERKLFATKRHEYSIEQIQYSTDHYFKENEIINNKVRVKLGLRNCIKDIYWFCNVEKNIKNNDLSNYTFNESAYNNIIMNVDLFNTLLRDGRFVTLQPLINKVFKRHRKMVSTLTVSQINISWFNEAELIELESLIKNITEYDATAAPIMNSKLLLLERHILNHDNKYTNYVIPYNKYENSLQDGLNTYSFALQPNNTTQPSGSLNMSVLEDVTLELAINRDVLINNNYIQVKVIGRSYNILRIFSGFGSVIY